MSSSGGSIEAVSQRLDIFTEARRAEASSLGLEAALFADAGASFLTGGKRLRARFCIAGWSAVEHLARAAAALPESLVAASAALEIFHAAALVHDDVIDNSDTRRGRPAAHRALESAHRAAAWSGDAEAFGRSGAILLGDLLVAWSDDLLEEGLALATASSACAARAAYRRMRQDVTMGQFLDIAEESAFLSAPDPEHAERALRVASLKSARYTVEQPLAIGASLAGADAAQLAALSAFGHPLGMAFQLRDDVLGVFGDESETGKPAGDDLREGKRTVLVAYAREVLAAADRRVVDELVGDPALDDSQIASLRRTIVETGALERVESLISDYTAQADRALSGARLADDAADELRGLARAATVRTA